MAQKEEKKTSWEQTVVTYLHDWLYLLIGIFVIFLLLFRVIGDYVLLLSNTLYKNPEYGDIVVISKQGFDNGKPIIKRVIATEGQSVDIDFDAGIVYVDGVALEEDYTYNLTTREEGTQFPLTVEENCIFVLGDNRGVSQDSRSPEVGQIDKREVLGKAIYLMLPGTNHGLDFRDYSRTGVIS